ncbi:hypothetical protein [Burkholderia gladioli]|uniref:hypothetical protein n=1 Tax=Burkholderia gladioli TaxID=28095 RepID=UPI0016413E56|nr:hypothetical protein [Burkholderia gladioli]
MMEEINISVDELFSLVKKNSFAGIRGHRYLPFLKEILALRVLGVRHRVIADWLNVKTKEQGSPYFITRDTLANLISYWKKTGIIDVDDSKFPGVVELVEQVRQANPIIKNAQGSVENLEDSLNKQGNFLEV